MESLHLLNTKQAEGRHGSGSWFLWTAHGSDSVALDFPRNAICQWISQTEQQLDPDEPIVLRVQNSSHTEQRSSFPGRFNSWSWVSLCMQTTLCVIMWSHWGNKQHLSRTSRLLDRFQRVVSFQTFIRRTLIHFHVKQQTGNNVF